MQKNNKPFFARFLESQELAAVNGGEAGHTNKHKDVVYTEKYPSDDDEIVTLKYPSDSEETGGEPI
jgi:hypothetical protein